MVSVSPDVDREGTAEELKEPPLAQPRGLASGGDVAPFVAAGVAAGAIVGHDFAVRRDDHGTRAGMMLIRALGQP